MEDQEYVTCGRQDGETSLSNQVFAMMSNEASPNASSRNEVLNGALKQALWKESAQQGGEGTWEARDMLQNCSAHGGCKVTPEQKCNTTLPQMITYVLHEERWMLKQS